MIYYRNMMKNIDIVTNYRFNYNLLAYEKGKRNIKKKT